MCFNILNINYTVNITENICHEVLRKLPLLQESGHSFKPGTESDIIQWEEEKKKKNGDRGSVYKTRQKYTQISNKSTILTHDKIIFFFKSCMRKYSCNKDIFVPN